MSGVVHRDMSCRNILVDSDGRMVLADLGLATRQLAAPEGNTPSVDESKVAVPVRWTSPESLRTQQCDAKSDVWSLGVALWECTTCGRTPYHEQPNTKLCIRAIAAGQLRLQVDPAWASSSGGGDAGWADMGAAERQLAEAVRRLVQACLTHSVEQRPDSEQLAAMVENEWERWKVEVGKEAADTLDRNWVQHHAEVQQRLGPPTEQMETVSQAAPGRDGTQAYGVSTDFDPLAHCEP